MHLDNHADIALRPASRLRIGFVLLPLLAGACATSPRGIEAMPPSKQAAAAITLQPPNSDAVQEAGQALRAHRQEVEAALAAVDGTSEPDEAHAAGYRQHLAVLAKLEVALEAYASDRTARADVVEAARTMAEAALGGFTSILLSEASAKTGGYELPPEVLAPYRVKTRGVRVAAAVLAALEPVETADEADLLVAVAAGLVEEAGTRSRAIDIARAGRALLDPRKEDRDARWALARSWWVEGKAAVADGQLDAGIERLTKATEAWGRPHTTFEWTLATALEAAGRYEEAAIRWALVEVDWGRPGEEQLQRLASVVDIEAARAAPEVVAFRDKREAALAERAARRERGRQPVASLELTDATARRTVDALRGGKPAVVVFWTSTCGACVMELPVLARLSRRLEALAVIPVNSDDDPAEGRRFLEQNGWDLPFHHLDDQSATFAAGVEVWPTTVLLDADGRECHRTRGYGDAASLEALLEGHAAGRCGEPASP